MEAPEQLAARLSGRWTISTRVEAGSITAKLDLDTRSGIDRLMIAFYAKATTDDLIGEFFTDVVPFDLRCHLPVIGDFWESVLLGTQAYRASLQVRVE
jgi:hemoglobin